ncbi:MAG: NYN domain-containing protein [Nitrospirae bacterium]|nr:NYN domain-containing protein [Nitrospirota bacterium]
MPNILIDGYNLIGIAHKSLEKARNDIIKALSEYSRLKGHDITIVFDGWKTGQAAETKLRTGGVNIIYSRLAENADSVIKKIISEAVKPWVVVSSDREISAFADRKGLVSLTAGEFEGRLYSALSTGSQKNEEPFEDDEDVDSVPARQKGNPRKLSQKQKKKINALKKL